MKKFKFDFSGFLPIISPKHLFSGENRFWFLQKRFDDTLIYHMQVFACDVTEDR